MPASDSKMTGVFLALAMLALGLLMYVPHWENSFLINPGTAPEPIQTVFQVGFLILFFGFLVLVIGSE